MPVRHRPMAPSLMTFLIAVLTKDRLVKNDAGLELLGNIQQMGRGVADAVDDGDGVGTAALLENGDIDGVLAVNPDDICL